jgi:hypothetical protein
MPGENLEIGLAELADRHAIYFLFLVFLLVPFVGQPCCNSRTGGDAAQ